MSRFQERTGERLHWRALVRTTGALDTSRASHGLSWHLVECADPTQPQSHCPVGADLLSTGADPDGHCLVDGTCPRCAPTPISTESQLEHASEGTADVPVSASVS
jgi:hypothetical protein